LSDATREVAERAVAGEIAFHFNGSRYISVGRSNIDWSGSHYHHQEWVAQLHRFFQLSSLAIAHRETGDTRYADAARDYISDWIDAHAPSDEWRINPFDNTLNLSIRTQEWVLTLPDFMRSSAYDDQLLQRMLDSVTVQFHYLLHHLSPIGNWRIAQADSLLQCGLVLADLPASADWRQAGVRILNDAFARQVMRDGVHLEFTPSYHVWMTEVFTRYWRLARAQPELGLSLSAARIAEMHEYCAAFTEPQGQPVPLHDSAFTREKLALDRVNGALDKRTAFRRDAGLPEALPPTAKFFPDAGQVFLREDWTKDADYLAFDASNWGGAHCHLSRNGLHVAAAGIPLLVDPGYLSYEASDPMMAHGKSTRAHNTMNLNGWNQSTANPTGTRHLTAPGYEFAISRYQGGYWPGSYAWWFSEGLRGGIFAEHLRALLWVRGKYALVFDYLLAYPSARDEALFWESNWQLVDGSLEVDPARGRAVIRQDGAGLLLAFPLRPDNHSLTVHRGETAPSRGWLPGTGDAYLPAPQLSLSAPYRGPVRQLTVLAPFRGSAVPQYDITATVRPEDNLTILNVNREDGSHDLLLFGSNYAQAIGQYGELETDATLLHLCYSSTGQITGGLALDGRYLLPEVEGVETCSS